MLRLRDGQATLWEQLLPEEIQLLAPELAAVDRLLDDPRFLAPFVERFSCPIGRPTIPIESYLRLMWLKHRHRLGDETLVKEVADSLSWRRFCRIGLHQRPPHPTTLMKLTRRFGPEIVEELNRALLGAGGGRQAASQAAGFGWTLPASRPTCATRPTPACARTRSVGWRGR